MEFIDHKEAAELLDIPELAIGQCLLDGKLIPKKGFVFNKEDVLDLKDKEQAYIKGLRF